MILARSLLGMTARIIYVDGPTDPAERKAQWTEYARDDLQHAIGTLEALQKAGDEIDEGSLRDIRTGPRDLGDGSALPGDSALIKQAGLLEAYNGLYRPASDFIHFGLARSIDELQDSETVDIDTRQDDLAEEALTYAITIYGILVHECECSLGHGLGRRIQCASGIVSGVPAGRRLTVSCGRPRRRTPPSCCRR